MNLAGGNNEKLRVVYGDSTLGVHGVGFDYIFSYAQGGLESIVKDGYEWLYRCSKPTFWRALTDNDRGSKFPSLTAKEAESPENTGFQPLFTHQKCSYILLFFSFLTGFLDA